MTKKTAKKKSVKTAKKKPAAKKRKNNKKGGQKLPLYAFLLKWALVLGIWGIIFLSGIVAWYAADLPEILATPNFERKASITVLDRNGHEIFRYGEIQGVSVQSQDLPPHLIDAVLAIEDRRFYKHHGVDLFGLSRAMAANIKAGRVVQGGSTITQQLAKNLFLSHERTYKRKVQEALLAFWLEKEMTKDQILSAYLNRVYMGAGAYGVDAASHVFFNKPVQEIDLFEAATLAGLLKAPSRYSPTSNPDASKERARVVIAAMEDAGMVERGESLKYKNDGPIPKSKPGDMNSHRYYSDWIINQIDDLIGATTEDLVIYTTMDPDLQKQAAAAVNGIVRANADKNVTQGAAIVMGLDGSVLAMVGGTNYSETQFNRAAQSLRQPGSSFKPFIYLTALENGWTMHDWVVDEPITHGKWRPKNYKGKYYGKVTLEEALTYSLNTVSYTLANDVGIDAIIDTGSKVGLLTPLERNMSIALGTQGLSMVELVGAYGTIANFGRRVPPFGIKRIETEDGKLYYERMQLSARSAFKHESIMQLRTMMQSVVENGTGRGAKLPWPAAGKTGTSQEHRDAWFMGFTDQYVAGVWVGNDNNSEMKRVTGGSVPAVAWKQIMLAAHKKRGPKPLEFYTSDENTPYGSGPNGAVEEVIFWNDPPPRPLYGPDAPVQPEPEQIPPSPQSKQNAFSSLLGRLTNNHER